MKKLYEFTLSKEAEVEKTETVVNDKGETVSTTRKVKENVAQRFFLRKPTRSLIDSSELYYGVKFAEGWNDGLLTNAQVKKRFSNDGGLFSEPEKENFAQLYVVFYNKKEELLKLKSKDEKEDKEAEDALVKELAQIREQLQAYEVAQASIYDQTAESRARSKTIFWWLLQIAYTEDDKGEPTALFGEGSFEQKLSSYDKIEEEENPFFQEVIRRFIYFISFWYVGRANTKEDFDVLATSFASGQIDLAAVPEGEPEKKPEA
jgi:hypothetical protein